MTSQSFDGEYIARIIQKLGFVAVRGSSSRGAVGAVIAMRNAIEAGQLAAFTIDGPRGPRYVAKPGPVLLAKATGVPMGAFYIALTDAWILKTWDALMIPKPFTRALLRVGKSIHVPQDADEQQMDALHRELQATLDRVRDFAEANVERAGTAEFPWYKVGAPQAGAEERAN